MNSKQGLCHANCYDDAPQIYKSENYILYARSLFLIKPWSFADFILFFVPLKMFHL